MRSPACRSNVNGSLPCLAAGGEGTAARLVNCALRKGQRGRLCTLRRAGRCWDGVAGTVILVDAQYKAEARMTVSATTPLQYPSLGRVWSTLPISGRPLCLFRRPQPSRASAPSPPVANPGSGAILPSTFGGGSGGGNGVVSPKRVGGNPDGEGKQQGPAGWELAVCYGLGMVAVWGLWHFGWCLVRSLHRAGASLGVAARRTAQLPKAGKPYSTALERAALRHAEALAQGVEGAGRSIGMGLAFSSALIAVAMVIAARQGPGSGGRAR